MNPIDECKSRPCAAPIERCSRHGREFLSVVGETRFDCPECYAEMVSAAVVRLNRQLPSDTRWTLRDPVGTKPAREPWTREEKRTALAVFAIATPIAIGIIYGLAWILRGFMMIGGAWK